MISYLKSCGKFLIKRIAGSARSVFLFLSGAAVNKNGWENRMLIVNLEALGDLVVFTSVLKHYKRRFPGKKIYLLMKKGLGIEILFKDKFVDEAILVDYKKFAANPFYGAGLINRLRKTGFKAVINHDFSASEILGKIIGASLGAEEVVGYEGLGAELRHPFDIQQRKNLEEVFLRIYPKYKKLIPGIDANDGFRGRWRGVIEHYAAIYEGATGFRENDYATELPAADAGPILDKLGLKPNSYVVLNFGASVAYKRWPVRNFAEVAETIAGRGMKIVLLGSAKEKKLAEDFRRHFAGDFTDLAGKTNFSEFSHLIKNCFLALTNDTAAVHLAVAMKKPSLCVTGGGQFGMFADYGYPDINKWVYKKTDCYGDNWLCGRGAGPNMPSPCVAAVGAETVKNELNGLIDYLKKNNYPAKKFEIAPAASAAAPKAKIKIVYSGIRAENYDSGRGGSFEYDNFYLTLKNMAGVEATEYPFDEIIRTGRKKFNENLLELVKKLKPDLFFAFMFSDELDRGTLDEIKKIAKSVAWFADDHWRLHNYSRFYAPHFTWAVTTWSEAPANYLHYGITNVLKSQWACNPAISRPVGAPCDIGVSFVGQRTAPRAAIIADLKKAGIDVFARGFGWPGGRVSRDEATGIFSRSKINLNFNAAVSKWSPRGLARLFLRRSLNKIVFDVRHPLGNFKSWLNLGIPQIKARPFEILGCGAFLISGRADNMGDYYEDGKEIVYYEDAVDLAEKIRYYSGRDDAREKIAEAGYAKTMSEHTYERRFRELFNKII